MTPDALEAVFVQRQRLLEDILQSVRQSAAEPPKRINTLLVGPRGFGKTHLTSLLYHRLRAMKDLKSQVLVAWLREEEWGVACFRDLLIRIVRALLPEDERLHRIYSLDADEAEVAAVSLLRELADTRSLVVLAENLDELLEKIGNPGENKLFHLLEDPLFCCLVATSTGPAARIFPPGSPFGKDFFQIQQLSELTLDDAVQLIFKLARYTGNRELEALIETPRGRARVRALRYLAGGNHRAYVIFAPLLTHESISSLIKPLMQTLDDLTPYYSSRIAALPLGQRKILEFVCERRHPVRALDVARACFVTAEMAASQLDLLCKMGHLQSLKLGEARYFELREPLMRLSFEVKKQRGKPLGLLLDFLRLWYSPSELRQRLSFPSSRLALESGGLPGSELLEQQWEDPRVSECCREYNAALEKGDYVCALETAEDLVSIRGRIEDFMAEASCLIRLGRTAEVVGVCDRMIAAGHHGASAWQMRAWALSRAGDYHEALSSCERSLELDPAASRTWCYKASILLSLRRPDAALECCEAAIRHGGEDTLAWTTRGTVLAELELFDEAFAAFSRVVQLDPHSAMARVHLSAALLELKKYPEALKQSEQAIEISPDDPEAWVLCASALDGLGRHQEAWDCLEKARSLGDDSSFVHFKSAELLFAADRWREGAARLDGALGRFARSENPTAGDTRSLLLRLLPGLCAPQIAQLSIKIIFLIHCKHGMQGALAQGLIECIPDVVSDALGEAEARLWRDSWQALAAPAPEFRLSLRLLDSALRYRETRDPGILMDLPQEERALLEPLLGVHVEAIA